MSFYTISNTVSGAVIGTFQGPSEAEALDAMARDAGYESYADQLEAIESDGSDIRVVEIVPIADTAYDVTSGDNIEVSKTETYRCVIERGNYGRDLQQTHEHGFTEEEREEHESDLDVLSLTGETLLRYLSDANNTVYVYDDKTGTYWLTSGEKPARKRLHA